MSTYNEHYYQARVDSIDVNDITSHPVKANTLLLLKENDTALPRMTGLTVCDEETYTGQSVCDYQYAPSKTDGDAGWFGYFIGKSTVMKSLNLQGGALNDFNSDTKQLCGGINLNRSIEEIRFSRVTGGDLFQELAPFFKHNHQLTSIAIHEWNFDVEGVQMLVQAISGCKRNCLKTISIKRDYNSIGHGLGDRNMADLILALSLQSSLEQISITRQNMGRNSCIALADLLQSTATSLTSLELDYSSVDDEGLETLAPALVGSQLQTLSLNNNPISLQGSRALALLLNDPNSNLEELWLYSNNIGDDGACVLATSLASNRKLRNLDIYGYEITQRGKDAFSKLLCNTSSVQNTFLSNHTLQTTGIADHDMGYYLNLNRLSDEKMAAAVKILKNHNHFKMRPLFEWDLKVLPHVIGWIDKANTYRTDFEKNIDQRKMYCIYQFIRAMPMLCIES